MKKDYDVAERDLITLGNYSDSAKFVKKIQYAAAENALENGDFVKAIDIFTEPGYYAAGQRLGGAAKRAAFGNTSHR